MLVDIVVEAAEKNIPAELVTLMEVEADVEVEVVRLEELDAVVDAKIGSTVIDPELMAELDSKLLEDGEDEGLESDVGRYWLATAAFVVADRLTLVEAEVLVNDDTKVVDELVGSVLAPSDEVATHPNVVDTEEVANPVVDKEEV